MKRLLWKELMELRWTPAAMAPMLLVAAFSVVLVFGWPISWVAPICFFGMGITVGCGTLAGEKGRGTLTFLSSLPLDRPMIWRAKLSAGALIAAASALGTLALLLLIDTALLAHGANMNWDPSDLLFDIRYPQWWLDMFVLLALGLFLSMAVSGLVDRTLTALILAMTGALGVLALSINVVSPYIYAASGVFYGSLGVTAIVFLAASYGLFCGDVRVVRWPLLLCWGVGVVLALSVNLIVSSISITGLNAGRDAGLTPAYTGGELVTSGDSATLIPPTWTYNFRTVRIGKVYTVTLDTGSQYHLPWRLVDLGNSVRSKVIVQHDLLDMQPQIQITYAPEGNSGPDTQIVRVFDDTGTEFADVVIKATKKL